MALPLALDNRSLPLAGLLALIIVALLSACAPTVPDRTPAAYTTEQKVERAQSLLTAARSAGDARDDLLLEAAQLFQEVDYRPSALNAFGAIDPAQLDDAAYIRYILSYAELALTMGDRANARSLLSAPRTTLQTSRLPREERFFWHELNGRLYSAPEESLLALRHRLAAAELAVSQADKQRSHDQLWATLSQLPESDLMRLSFEDPTGALAGWTDLAIVLRASGDNIDAQQEAFNQWRQRQPGHPASALPPEALGELERFAREMPQQIALLLPLSGPLADAGRAVRDGYLTAHFQALTQGGSPPQIRLYDTGKGDGTDIVALYQQASLEGAEVVLGPLQKNELATLVQQVELSTPLLGLNRLDDELALTPHDTLYQFGLPPEDEARQVADRAWHDGQRTALIIAPDNNWGQRAATAFRERWQQLGGSIATTRLYSLNQSDYSEIVRPALGIDDSAERHSRLERTLSRNLAFTPTRRPDIDTVLMLAQPAQARLIKPTLDFYFAGDLPIYATSQIYNGSDEANRNRDLDGIRFTIEPWNLSGMIPQALRPYHGMPANLWSFHGLGVDAFHLQQRLQQLRQNPHLTLPGSSGLLRIQQTGVVQRELPWAEFQLGRVQPLRAPES